MSTLLIAFNGGLENGQFLGDTLVAVKCAWAFAKDVAHSKLVLTLSPKGQLNFLWERFIREHGAQVIYDSLPPGDNDARHLMWNRWYKERSADGVPFDHYRELYLRIHGGMRQAVLCGGEKGLGRRNIFEYFLFGQENDPGPAALAESRHFRSDLIDHEPVPYDRDVFVAVEAKCQGNDVFTKDKPIPRPWADATGAPFWDQVIRRVAEAGFSVTVNARGPYCDDAPGVARSFKPFKELVREIQRHRLVVCGNTGIMWLAGALGVPVLLMQHDESNMQDYRAEWCGLESLIEFVRTPDVGYVVGRISEELSRRTVLTTGCYDLLHAGHVRHLEESRSLGDRLVVALNSDESIRRTKGEGRPVRNEQDRAEVLKALRCVDDVIVYDGDNLPLVHKLRPQVLTNGSDHKLEEVVGKDFVEACGGLVVVTGGERVVSTTRIIQKITGAEVIKACKDAERHSVNPYHKLKFLADQVLAVEHVPGAFADLGTYRGGTALVMHLLAPERELHCFDTWDGMKEVDPLCHHKPGEWKWDLKECRSIFGGEKPHLHFHKGDFPSTAADLGEGKFSLVYVDMDTYQSTLDALRWAWPRLEKGGRLIVDDVPWAPCAGTEKAVREFFAKDQLREFPEAHAVMVIKESA